MNREDIIRMAREAVRLPEPQTPQEEAIERAIAPIFERFAALVATEKEKQIIDMLERLQERNESHNYYAYAINVIQARA